MAHLLGAENLRIAFPHRTVLESVSLGVDEGDRIGVVGRNGDGKSTLMRLLAGIATPDSGRVTVRGGVTIGMLDQSDTLDPDLTIAHAVVGDTPEHVWAGDAKVRDVISGLLGDLPWDGRVGDLSGGQRRRVALAALLTGDDDVLFLDEPTNHLDVAAQLELMALVRGVANDGVAVVVVLHDLTTALRWCDHVVVLDDGRVAAAGAPDQVLTPELLAAVWGVRAEILRAADGTPTIAYLGPAAPDSGR